MNDITTLIATTVTTGVHVRPSAYILPALVTIGIIVLIVKKSRGKDEPDTYTNPYAVGHEHTVDNAGSAGDANNGDENVDNAGGVSGGDDNAGSGVNNGDNAGGVDSTEND